MLPEEKARLKIDESLKEAGWDIVSRDEYVPGLPLAVKEALMKGNHESDYLLFVDNKAIAVLEAKREEIDIENNETVSSQVENYANTPEKWYDLWFDKIPLVYISNGKKILYKNLLDENSKYEEIDKMHSPKKMLKLINKTSDYGTLVRLDKEQNGKLLRDCQYEAELKLEDSIRNGNKKSLAILATGAGKTYLGCLATYRLLNYTKVKRVLFLVDRNNLGTQALNEFSMFDRTEKGDKLTDLYTINKLKKNEDINSDIVISTIQKLFAALTGNKITDEDEDKEDEIINNNEKDDDKEIELGDNIKLPQDYFDFIIVDECHRSIYGKWKKVLDYFNNAIILGLTATPTDEAYAFFNKNIVEKYSYEESIIDGVNVPSRIYRIKTKTTTFGGSINIGNMVDELSKKSNEETRYRSGIKVDFTNSALDRTITDKDQIRTVLENYRDAIYTDLYPEREAVWEYTPKTLIFAKDDNHAKEIVKICEEVFKEKFNNNELPKGFVQRITYSSENTQGLIRDLNFDKNFRIAVTVTLVATGTDVKPLEVVLFMKDVKSDVLYTQMKGRGCRTISSDKFKEITPNAEYKDRFYIVDAIGVTETEKNIPRTSNDKKDSKNKLNIENLFEHLAHGEVSDENLVLLRDYLSTINNRYANNQLFGRHLTELIEKYNLSPKNLADKINNKIENNLLPEYKDIREANTERKELVNELISNIPARNKVLELYKGYKVSFSDNKDEVIYKGFSIESAKPFIENFEKYINSHVEEIEALRILYNGNNEIITHDMLVDVKERLMNENSLFKPYSIWTNYQVLDNIYVEKLDTKYNVNALTNYIPLCSFAMKKNSKLSSLFGQYLKRYNLYLGMSQRTLSADQEIVMRRISEYIINDGAITSEELNTIDADLWRNGINAFKNIQLLSNEMSTLAKFILKVA